MHGSILCNQKHESLFLELAEEAVPLDVSGPDTVGWGVGDSPVEDPVTFTIGVEE